MSDKIKSPDELRAEIAQIDVDLQKLVDREQAAEVAADKLALAVYRGDKKAETKIGKHDGERAEAASWRRRLQVARSAVEGELQAALALERSEETKAKAREAREIATGFRKRGAAIDAAFRSAVDEYFGLLDDAAALEKLGARVNPALVLANCKRAVRAALTRLKIDGVALVPPLERATFTQLVGNWASTAERWISMVLDEPPATPTTPTTPTISGEMPPASEIPSAAAQNFAAHGNIHINDGSDPIF